MSLPRQPATPGADDEPAFQPATTRGRVTAQLLDLLTDDDVTEVILSGPHNVRAKRHGTYVLTDIDFGDVETYHRWIDAELLARCDTTHGVGQGAGIIEAQLSLDVGDPLPLTARVVLIGPPARAQAIATIAKRSRQLFTLDALVTNRTLPPLAAAFLQAVVRARLNLVVTGPSGSSKTTLIEALSHDIDPADRILVFEDTRELRLACPHVEYVQAVHPPPGDDTPPVDLAYLVRLGKRLRGDRIIVGECRGAEFSDWLNAATSGVTGCMTTLHAASAEDAVDTMIEFALEAPGATPAVAWSKVGRAVQLVAHLDLVNGRPVVTSIAEVQLLHGAPPTRAEVLRYAAAGSNTWNGEPLSERMRTTLHSRGVPDRPEWLGGI